MSDAIQIRAGDTVAVALKSLVAGEKVQVQEESFTLLEDIPQGHKLAVRDIKSGEKIIKYGYSIGHAKEDIAVGEWVHTHNLVTDLAEGVGYTYSPCAQRLTPQTAETFMGYRRTDGGVGVRNEIWIIPTVGCVNEVAARLAKQNEHLLAGTNLDGIFALTHPYGCSQMGEDHETTKNLLAALAHHGNAGGVLIIGLGCENNTMQKFREAVGEYDDNRVKFMVCQEEEDELAAGGELLADLVKYASGFSRTAIPASKLTVGMKCGGSDGLSGITANPTVGVFCDMLAARGGRVVLTEVPEMFGAESVLMNRAVDEKVFNKAVDMVNSFKKYFSSHGQSIYENPSPGNKAGGISTLEDKSLGCVQKGGLAPVCDVIGYAQPVKTDGLTLMSGPGNDLVSATALAAAGAQIILFTTGRGTPFGAPVPTVKISSNTALAQKKAAWIDFNAGAIADGEEIPTVAGRLYDMVLKIASGEILTKTEQAGYHGIAIWKDGVTL